MNRKKQKDDLIQEVETSLIEHNTYCVSQYIKKLNSNKGNCEKFYDLLCEANIALALLEHDFGIKMREEGPDLEVVFPDLEQKFYIEVKRFYHKKQDDIDDVNLRNYNGRLVEYGGPTLQGEEGTPWEQVYNVAKKKCHQYIADSINILAIISDSSNCIDDSIIPTVINMIDEAIIHCDCQDLRKLNGIMLFSYMYNLSKRRSVYFFETKSMMPNKVKEALHSITKWNPIVKT